VSAPEVHVGSDPPARAPNSESVSSGVEPGAVPAEAVATPAEPVATARSSDVRTVLDRWREGLGSSSGPPELRARFEHVLSRLSVTPLTVGVVLVLTAVGSALAVYAVMSPGEPVLAPPGTRVAPLERSTGAGTAPGTTRADHTADPARSEVFVHAAGAVISPGLYRLSPGSRVSDVIRAAGGLAGDADVDRINLAAPIADGDRLYVPRRDEATAPSVVAADGSGRPSGSMRPGPTDKPAGPVNLNTATAAELDTLPGVGPATSAAIIDYRTQHGPFRSVDDLAKVRGIGKAKLEQLRPLVIT